MDYTSPITTTFEMQRATIEQGHRALKQGMEAQRSMNRAMVDSMDSQESAQRRLVELSRTLTESYLDAVESTMPGMGGTVEEMRTALDDQYEFLLENHAEAFDSMEVEMGEGADAYEELTDDYMGAVDEQIEMIVEAHEELEDQSVEATRQFAEQFDQLQEQVEEVQEQVREVQEQAAEAVEA